MEPVALLNERPLQLQGQTDGMGADALIEAVGEERAELDAQQTSLGQKRTVLLDEGEEMGQPFGTGSHHRLPEEGTNLGATDVEHVAQTGNVPQRNVRSLGCQPVTQAGAVHI